MNNFQPRWKKQVTPGRVAPVVVSAEVGENTEAASNGVDTLLWGPGLWNALHTASLIGSADALAAIAIALANSIPCPECTEHYKTWLAEHPVVGVTDMVSWFLDIHNSVNLRNGKATWTLETIQNTYLDVTGASTALTGVSEYLSAEVVGMLRAILN